jgi:hypothetical protein
VVCCSEWVARVAWRAAGLVERVSNECLGVTFSSATRPKRPRRRRWRLPTLQRQRQQLRSLPAGGRRPPTATGPPCGRSRHPETAAPARRSCPATPARTNTAPRWQQRRWWAPPGQGWPAVSRGDTSPEASLEHSPLHTPPSTPRPRCSHSSHGKSSSLLRSWLSACKATANTGARAHTHTHTHNTREQGTWQRALWRAHGSHAPLSLRAPPCVSQPSLEPPHRPHLVFLPWALTFGSACFRGSQVQALFPTSTPVPTVLPQQGAWPTTSELE